MSCAGRRRPGDTEAVMTTLMIAEICVVTLPLPALALVALLRTPRQDIPRVVEALARWWRR